MAWSATWGNSNPGFYEEMKARGRIEQEEIRPDIQDQRILIEAYRELNSERSMSGLLPVSRIREYLVRHRLPDYWEAIIIKIEAHSASVETENGDN